MKLLTDTEFARMEHLLAGLLPDAAPVEEAAIFTLHDRLKRLHEAQHNLRNCRERLVSLSPYQFNTIDPSPADSTQTQRL